MKVTIITEGGKRIGFGHIRRCNAIFDAFKAMGASPRIVVYGDHSAKHLLSGREHLIFDWLRHPQKLLRLLKGSDIALIDSYLADKALYENIRENVRLAAYWDDNKRLDYPPGVIVNGSIYGRQLRYPAKNKVLAGPDYIALNREFSHPGKKRITRAAGNILLTLGGSDESCLALGITKLLISRYPGIIKNVVIGKGSRCAPELKKIKDASLRVHYSPIPGKFLKLMQEADIAVSGGGQTLHELARLGVPAIAVILAENQERNTLGWVRSGYMESAGRCRDNDLPERIAGKIDRLMPYQVRLAKSRLGSSLVDGKGAERIAAALLKESASRRSISITSLRKACVKDCRDLWRWRNDPLVRRSSFDNSPIPYQSHKKWFVDKLSAKDSAIYIAESGKSGKLGQARFDLDSPRSARISVSLNPRFLGKGIGTQLISFSTQLYLEKSAFAKKVSAEIVDGNPASVKAFSRAGYIFARRGKKNGRRMKVYEFKNAKR